jgi:hypothetical protein
VAGAYPEFFRERSPATSIATIAGIVEAGSIYVSMQGRDGSGLTTILFRDELDWLKDPPGTIKSTGMP